MQTHRLPVAKRHIFFSHCIPVFDFFSSVNISRQNPCGLVCSDGTKSSLCVV